ncbi:MAG: hypothetical protein QY314_00800 [Candidatus Dojkabacteria bacterium]|nr:MAG: hypothetical protein QY314_00800 [Candidatus Dojkabacteria bacterium]
MIIKLRKALVYALLFAGIIMIVGLLLYSLVTYLPTYGTFNYPEYYTNNALINKITVHNLVRPMVRDASQGFVPTTMPVYKVTTSKIDPTVIIDSEQLVTKLESSFIEEQESYTSADEEKFLTIFSGEVPKFVLFANKGISSGNVECGNAVPGFVSFLFPNITLTAEEIATGTSSCEVSIYQTLDSVKVVTKELGPLCRFFVTDKVVTRFECSVEYLQTSEHLQYRIVSSWENIDEIQKKHEEFTIVSYHDLHCDGEGCEEVSSASLNEVPRNMQLTTADIVYATIVKDKQLYAMPHHRLFLNGTLRQPIGGAAPQAIPTTYYIFYPAIEFRHFIK